MRAFVVEACSQCLSEKVEDFEIDVAEAWH